MKRGSFVQTIMALLTFALIQICLARANSGLDIMSSNTPSLSLESGGIVINLDLGNGKVYNSKSYKDAITFIEDLKTASSCHRLAASSLINVCQSINQDSSVELALADTKEEYAAKIAACELNVVRGRGKDAIPKPCKNFLPNKDACPKTQHEPKKRCYAPLSRVQITACINALEDRPQSWTSYSNALQNVQNACQASRLAIEKDTILDQYKAAMQTSAEATQNSQDALNRNVAIFNNHIAHLQEVRDDIRVSIKRDLMQAVNGVSKDTKNMFSSVLLKVDSAWSNLTSYFTQSSDFVIARNEQALQSADLVQAAVSENLVAVQELGRQTKAFHQLSNNGNTQIIHNQDLILSRNGENLEKIDAMKAAITDQLANLAEMEAATAELRKMTTEAKIIAAELHNMTAETKANVLNSTSSLVPFLEAIGPLNHALAPLVALVTNAYKLDWLTMIGIVFSVISSVGLGFKFIRSGKFSLNAWLFILGSMGTILGSRTSAGISTYTKYAIPWICSIPCLIASVLGLCGILPAFVKCFIIQVCKAVIGGSINTPRRTSASISGAATRQTQFADQVTNTGLPTPPATPRQTDTEFGLTTATPSRPENLNTGKKLLKNRKVRGETEPAFGSSIWP